MVKIDDLNDEQRAAVTHTHGPMMILAGAGTGKTRVITYRIAYMIGAGIPPDQIVALSFTNKAAREMTERVKHLIGERAKRLWLGTFHSFCLHILRLYPQEAGLTKGFGLVATSDQVHLVSKALDEKGWAGEYNAEKMHAQISTAKNYLLTPEDLRKGPVDPKVTDDPVVLADVLEMYERQLRLNRVIDFDDCIYKCVKLLEAHPSVRAKLREKYRFLMVDEYQDTNQAQLSVLGLLASDEHDVCVVGDDDQSIYSWRGAMFEVLQRFEEMFPGTKIVKLEQNYRCSNIILGAANAVIKNNPVRKDKTLWSASKETTPIELVPHEDEQAEANWVAQKCLTMLGQGMQPKDMAVLYRANAQAKPIELALRESRISCKTYGGQSFFERKEVKDFMCYFRLVMDHEDRLALWRVVNTPNRGIGMKTLEKIEEAANARGMSPYAVMSAGTPIGAGAKADQAVQDFASMIQELSNMPLDTPEEVEAVGTAIIKMSHLEQDIREKSEDGGSRDRKIQNLRSLPKWLAKLAEDLIEEDGRVDQRRLLDIVSLDNDRREKDDGGNHVSLMSIHGSKGLEFPAVFVIGLEEELLPHKNSMLDAKAVCEERRLFYVAVTRAKTRLHLSYCVERNAGQNRVLRVKTRFLKEMPTEGLEDMGSLAAQLKAKKSEEERRNTTVSRLGALRAKLGDAPRK